MDLIGVVIGARKDATAALLKSLNSPCDFRAQEVGTKITWSVQPLKFNGRRRP
jgi:hypothetical protein